jgi:D-alanyl-D-alanine carboxypeptidase (penicillin-binding protein 5/6)
MSFAASPAGANEQRLQTANDAVAIFSRIIRMLVLHSMHITRFSVLAATAGLLSVISLTGPSARAASAAAYAISDSTTGFLIEGQNQRKKLQIGSLTKIATAMVVLDWAEARHQEMSELATVPESAEPLNSSGTGVGFHTGDRCGLKDLMYAALMQSDNQAAETLADHVGRALGSGQTPPVTFFVAQMNALVRRLGMRDTRFLNPHGLEGLERSLPYSTAEDMTLLTRYAMQNPAFVFYVSQKERKITYYPGGGSEASNYLLRNTNELLGVDNIDGVKTGTTPGSRASR